jgi:single-strand DNA-binding protein
MYQKVIIIGRLGKDPEIRYTQDGKPIANMTLATDESYKDKNGDKVSKTEWHRIVVYGKLAEICTEYLAKGKLCMIEGKLQTRTWEDKEGQKHSTTEIICSEMRMLGSKSESNTEKTASGIESGMDDVPF